MPPNVSSSGVPCESSSSSRRLPRAGFAPAFCERAVLLARAGLLALSARFRFADFSLREVRILICASLYLAFGNRRCQTALLVLVRTVMGIFGEDLDHLFCSTAVRMLCIYILSTGRALLHSCTSWPNAGFIPIYA